TAAIVWSGSAAKAAGTPTEVSPRAAAATVAASAMGRGAWSFMTVLSLTVRCGQCCLPPKGGHGDSNPYARRFQGISPNAHVRAAAHQSSSCGDDLSHVLLCRCSERLSQPAEEGNAVEARPV